MTDIIDYWPFDFEPRKIQIHALNWLQDQTAKYNLLEAPVGSGKSAIAMTYSQFLLQRQDKPHGDSFILTPQRFLQRQYEDTVRTNLKVNLASFYGRGNYSCKNKHTSCDIGSIIKPVCFDCPYTTARKQAQASADCVMNYQLALTAFTFTTTFERRTLMTMDECHTLEQALVNFDAVKIFEGRCKKYKVPFKKFDDITKAATWAKEIYLPAISSVLDDMLEERDYLMDQEDISDPEIRRIKEINNFQEHVDEISLVTFYKPEDCVKHFVLCWDDNSIEFKRITGRYSFKNIIQPMADKFLFMSSTILNSDGFCEDLGIDKKETAFLSLPSEFDPKKRSVVYMPQCKMNAKWHTSENAKGRRKMLGTIEKLCEMHQGESGLIHTANFRIAEWLAESLQIPHKIYDHHPNKKLDRNRVIELFQEDTEPSILISPSSTEGLDLKDDLGRFVIFAKVPFGFLGDQWIKRRMKMSDEWYKRRALIDIIQGGGRIVRSAEDYGQVYILDESFGFLYQTTQNMVPGWWKEAYNTL